MMTRPLISTPISKRTNNRSADAAHSAKQACPADHDRGDHPQLVARAGNRLGRA